MSPSERTIMVEFLISYQSHTCLWNTNDKHYRNKKEREIALNDLLRILKKYDQTANLASVSKKINSLRTCFKKEHKKVIASQELGDPDLLYTPTLWSYNLLRFLVDENTEEMSNDLTLLLTESAAENSEMSGNEDSIHLNSSYSKTDSESVSSSYNEDSINKSQNTRKRKVKIKSIEKLPKRLKISKQKYSAYGEHVAEKLRNMPENMASYCQKIINDALFHADFGNLNYTSHIVTEVI